MNLCSHTPTLVVADSRGLSVRHVGFYRADAQVRPELRITRQAFDAPGRLLATSDPRLDRPSTSTVFSLSGQPLLTENVDAGWRLTLFGEAGQSLESRDSRGTLASVEYDEMMRPVLMAEALDGEPARVSDRFIYGDAGAHWAVHNQCGRLLRRDDPAGSVGFSAYGLTGTVLQQERRFLAQTASVDWPQEPSQRDLLLEAQRYLSTSRVNASGEVFEQTDAQENRRFMAYACSGELRSTALQSSGSEKVLVLVSDILYDAMGAAEREVGGNGVISSATYDPVNGRLSRLLALSREGQVLQDLNYGYDPVGNVVSVEDAAQPVSFFKNQRVDPINRYIYDSLYQLIEATGREVAPVSHLPGLPGLQPLPLDPGNLINYTQRFEYDAGVNLLARHHSGAETWRMAVSPMSNRSLPQRADGTLPDQGQIAEAFDGNGNLKALQPGQAMTWDARNQLSEVTAVKRDDGPDDSELYRYDGDGQRVRKVRVSQARSRMLTAEVRYLPGLEIHRNEATGEVRHFLTVEAGRNSVRLLHWESGKPDGIENDQLRYSLSDHLGSSTLELDQDAKLISHEGYYPFGGTAWWVARSAVEANYKTVRYSGKERDATGLYYYGFRYYAPWLQRWVNPDPAGDVQGLNRYTFVKNNPVTLVDAEGLSPVKPLSVSIGQTGRWRLNEITLSASDLSRDNLEETGVGHDVRAKIVLSYSPGFMDKITRAFEETPRLRWNEKITMNEISDEQTWSFTADMYEHHPTSQSLIVWPRRYIKAYNSVFNIPELERGSVALKNKEGHAVRPNQLRQGLENDWEKAKEIRSFLKASGGILEIEIHDVPALHLRDSSHRERLLEISVGVGDSTMKADLKQYVLVNTQQARKVSASLSEDANLSVDPITLNAVPPPELVRRCRPALFNRGEYH